MGYVTLDIESSYVSDYCIHVAIEGMGHQTIPNDATRASLNESCSTIWVRFHNIRAYVYRLITYRIQEKEMQRSYSIEMVLQTIPNLKHGNDGLIFTCAESGYVIGTDQRMYTSSRQLVAGTCSFVLYLV